MIDNPPTKTTSIPFSIPLLMAFLAGCAGFLLFSYNSGYGFDATEYLVIGRSLSEGMPLYTYIPMKSPGIYWFVALLMRCGVSFDHQSLAVVLTAIFAGVVASTYLVAARWCSWRIAVPAAVLTAMAAVFMEINFLEPTPFFFLGGLAAFHFMLKFEQTSANRYLFLCGAATGFGLAFKATAALYGLACALHLVMRWLARRDSTGLLVVRGAMLAAGAFCVIGAVGAYFAVHGLLRDFIQWTFVFPLVDYPSNTTYLSKIYTKLLWVHVLVIGTVPFLISARVRNRIFQDSIAVLALLFGVCAYLAGLKTQASHYFFPGAPFLLLFSVLVYNEALAPSAISPRFIKIFYAVGIGVVGVMLASTWLYRPDAIRRLTGVKDFSSDEEQVRRFVQAHVASDQYVLMGGGGSPSTWLYWISRRYPPPPLINNDAKTIWMLRHEPAQVYASLENPQLELVQFEPDEITQPRLEDVFGNEPEDAGLMREYLARIRRRFVQIRSPLPGETFWARQADVLDPQSPH